MRKLLIDMDKPERLTYRRWRFCQEYIIDYNGTRAAKAAGYSEEAAQSEASRLLTIAIIQSTIAELEQDRIDAAKITGEKIIKNLARLAEKAETKGDESTAVRANEILGRGKLWEKGGRGIKAEIDKGADGTMKITFEEGE